MALHVAFLFVCIISVGLGLYGPSLRVLVKRRKDEFNAPFYMLIFNLAVADIGELFVFGLLFTVPNILAGRSIYGEAIVSFAACFETTMYMTIFGTTTVMTLSRFAAIAAPMAGLPSLYKRAFGQKPMRLWIGGIWAHALFMISQRLYFGCVPTISPDLLGTSYDCNSTLSQTANDISSLYLNVMVGLVAMGLNIATAVLMRLRLITSKTIDLKKHRADVRFFVQSLTVYAIFFCSTMSYTVIMNFNLRTYFYFAAAFTLIFFNSAITPAIYLLFNPPLRKLVLAWLRGRGDVAAVDGTAGAASGKTSVSVRKVSTKLQPLSIAVKPED